MRRQLLSLSIDLLLIALATLLAVVVRDNFDVRPDRIQAVLPYLLLTLFAATAVLPVSGLTRSVWRFTTFSDYSRVVPAVIAVVLAAMGSGFLFNRLDHVARALPAMQAILMIFLLVGCRVAFRQYHAGRRPRARLLQPAAINQAESVLLVGLNRVADLYLTSIKEFASGSLTVVGVLAKADRHAGRTAQDVPILGVPEDAIGIINDLTVRGVAVQRIVVTMAFDRLSSEAQRVLLQIERTTNIKLDLFSERLLIDERLGLRTVRDGLGTRPVAPPTAFVIADDKLQALADRSYWKVKRLFDVALAAFLLLLLAPLFVVAGILVAVDVGWPVTFWQQRPGLAGTAFRLMKFRTMASAHDSRGNRIADSARLSSIGSFLRRTRLDELPQLLHILSGRMSFVGPRPLLPVDQSPAYAARLLVRPGLTGWAQIKGGRAISAHDKAALDVWYVGNASLGLDLSILLQTIPIILYGERIDRVAIRKAWQDLTNRGICAPSERKRSIEEKGALA